MQNRKILNGQVALNTYRRKGPGETLVCVHGLTDNAQSLIEVARALGSYYDVVSYDLRAHGLSDEGADCDSTRVLVADMLAVFDRLELERPTLIGHSLGAEISLSFALSNPERVRAAVLVDPPWRKDWCGTPDASRHQAYEAWCKWLAHLQTLSLSEVIELGRKETPHWSDGDIVQWAQSKHECRMSALKSVLSVRPPWQSMIEAVSFPTLLVTGDTSRGAIVSYAMAQEAKKLSPHVRVATIPGVGHGMFRDNPKEFVEILREFLRI